MSKLKVFVILLVVIFFFSGCGVKNSQTTSNETVNQTSGNNTEGSGSWAKIYPGPVGFNSVQEMPDKGYILVGDTNFWDGGTISDVFILKINSKGDKEWAKTYGQNKSYNGMPVVQLTNDGGYFVASITGSYVKGASRFIIVKFNSNDEEEWAKAYGLGDENVVSYPTDFSIQQTTDGGYIVASWIFRNCFILKLNSEGNKEWLKILNITMFHSAKQTDDGGYIVVGGMGDHPMGLLVKLGKDGSIEWAKKYEVNKLGNDFTDVVQTNDGGYIAIASHLVLKVDKNGNEEWKKEFGLNIRSIEKTNDGGCIIVGWKTNSDKDNGFILKLNSEGDIEWGKIADEDYHFNVIRNTTDKGYIVAGAGAEMIGSEVVNGKLHPIYIGKGVAVKTDSQGNIKNCSFLVDFKPETIANPLEIKTTDVTNYIKIEKEPSFRAEPINLSFIAEDVQVLPICSGY